MSIVFVAGPPCAGKSTFIKKNFPDRKVIDIFTYQSKRMSIQSLIKASEDCLKDILDSIKNNENIVIEHTLLKAIRREPYIKAIKEITNENIEMYFCLPEIEEHKNRFKKRGIEVFGTEVEDYHEIIEIPTIEEGFSIVAIQK